MGDKLSRMGRFRACACAWSGAELVLGVVLHYGPRLHWIRPTEPFTPASAAREQLCLRLAST